MEPKETLKSLRAKAKELRSKVSSAPLSKATPDQLRSEILMLERAVKAEQKALEKKAAKEATKLPSPKDGMAQKKKTTVVLKAVVQKTMEDREKELLKRERQLLKKEKAQQKPLDTDSD